MDYLRPLTPTSNDILGTLTPHALTLGRHYDPDDQAVGSRMVYSGDRHWIIFGPNGSGKSLRLLVPNLLQSVFRSFLVLDVKGQLSAITAAYRATLGPVYVINPYGLWADDPRYPGLESCGYNPLSKLDPASDEFTSEAALIAAALIEVNEKEPHWGESARNLLTMLIMYTVLEAHDLLPDQVTEWAEAAGVPAPKAKGIATLGRVRRLLCLPSREMAAANSYKGSGIVAIALAVQASENDALIDLAGQFTEWSKEISGVASTARTQTAWVSDKRMAEDLAKEGPDFRVMKEQPTSVYLVLPPKHLKRYSKWLRLLVSQALVTLMDEPQSGAPPAAFVLEEMAALGHLEVIETTYALVRDYKIQIISVWQDLGQLKRIYKEGWETMITNAGIVTTFATDGETAEWFSKQSGETSRDVTSFNQSKTTTKNPPHSPQHAMFSAVLGNEGTSATESFNVTPTKTRVAHAHSFKGMKAGATASYFAGEPDIILGYAPFWENILACEKKGRKDPYRPS